MIVTSCKPYGIIRGMLKKWKKVGIVSCNSCARVCETGGKDKMEELATRLKTDGFDVVDMIPMRRQNIEFKIGILETTGKWLATKPTSGIGAPPPMRVAKRVSKVSK